MKPKLLESTESSSPIITRAVAAGLRGEYCDNYILPAWQKYLLRTLTLFPQSLSQEVISRFQTISGLPPTLLSNFKFDELINERINDYANIAGQFSCITLGAALGGATSYISQVLGSPFLPQAFVITLKGGSPKGDVNQYFQRTAKQALEIAETNPELITIQHFDPIHDGWLTRFVNHLRFKLITIPKGYIDFIRNKLMDGGTVVYLDGQAEWLRYKLGPRSYFQVGGWGDVSPQEFIDGSPRIQAYIYRTGLKNSNWKLEGYPLEVGPESEWGSEPGLAEALQTFCEEEGYKFVHIRLRHPNDFSKLAFKTAEYLLDKTGSKPTGVLVEMFTQFDSQAAIRSGLLPLWLIFNTKDSLDYLREMRVRFPTNKPVFFSPLSTFSITPDLVPWSDWGSALEGLDWVNIGTRSSHYPADPLTIVNWTDSLRSWVEENPQPLECTIDPQELLNLSLDLMNTA